jgi:hypothetical protein
MHGIPARLTCAVIFALACGKMVGGEMAAKPAEAALTGEAPAAASAIEGRRSSEAPVSPASVWLV